MKLHETRFGTVGPQVWRRGPAGCLVNVLFYGSSQVPTANGHKKREYARAGNEAPLRHKFRHIFFQNTCLCPSNLMLKPKVVDIFSIDATDVYLRPCFSWAQHKYPLRTACTKQYRYNLYYKITKNRYTKSDYRKNISSKWPTKPKGWSPGHTVNICCELLAHKNVYTTIQEKMRKITWKPYSTNIRCELLAQNNVDIRPPQEHT